jgi:hypothetical protein
MKAVHPHRGDDPAVPDVTDLKAQEMLVSDKGKGFLPGDGKWPDAMKQQADRFDDPVGRRAGLQEGAVAPPPR